MNDPTQRAPLPRERGAKGSSSRAGYSDDSGQLTFGDGLDEGRRRRDDGMRTAEHAAHPWARAAIDRIIGELAAEGVDFTSDTVRQRGGEPLASSGSLMGARINAAARSGLIVPVGATNSTRASRHSGLIRVWRGAGGGA